MALAIIDIRCRSCERTFVYRKHMQGEFKDGRYTCPKCSKGKPK